MSKTVVFITGANTGLGLEIVKALYQSDKAYDIVIGSRKVENGASAVSEVEKLDSNSSSSLTVVQIDVASDDSISKAIKTIESKFGHIDVLINNAGSSFDGHIRDKKMSMRDAWNESWNVNVAGTQVLTHEAIPLLLKSKDPRLMFMTSGTSSIAETEDLSNPILQRINGPMPAGWPKDAGINPIVSYRSTKAGLNMMMRTWHQTLFNDGVKVWCISPGFLATNLAGVGAEKLRQMGAKDPSEGGKFVKDVVEGKRDGDAGKAIRFDMIQPW